MDIKKELEATLRKIDAELNYFQIKPEALSNLLIAKANVLMALQKYE